MMSRKRCIMNKIEIELKDKKDFVNKYNSNRISSDLYNYIKEENKILDIKEKINIEIKPQFKMTDEEKELLALNIKKTTSEEIKDLEYVEQKVIFKELLFLAIGIIITFFWFVVRKSEFISEIILIIGWLFVWEAVKKLVFSRVEHRLNIKRLKKIVKSDIDYKD